MKRFLLWPLLCVAVLFGMTKSTFGATLSTVAATSSGKKMVVINGKKTPLFWAGGITRSSDLSTYKSMGFNTVVVRLYWGPSTDGSLVPEDLHPQQQFAQMAASQGLYVIYALPAAPVDKKDQMTLSAAQRAYMMMWSSWVQGAIKVLSPTPNLIGWMLPDDPRALNTTSNSDFQGWLTTRYPSIVALNREWKTHFSDYKDVTLAGVNQLAQQWRGTPPPSGNITKSNFRAYVKQLNRKRAGSPNWAFHPAALALGLYRWDNYRALLDHWAQTIHQADPQHIVFSGALHDYAELLALPKSVDVSLPALWPGLAENDLQTANPQSVDIARRANQYCAMPLFATSLQSGGKVTAHMHRWIKEALAHGASGMALQSWGDIKQDTALQKVIKSTFATLQSPQNKHWWQQAPVSTVAVLLTPLADGYTRTTVTKSKPMQVTPGRIMRAPAPRQSEKEQVKQRGLYGFCTNLVDGEPSDLVYALRWGTEFGGVDYISPDDLGHVNLQRYSTILAPQAYSTSPGDIAALANYVSSGGALVADIGIGAAQAGGQVVQFAKGLNGLFGVIPQKMQVVAFNLTPGPDARLLPAWGAMVRGTKTRMTAGDGPDGAAFAGPALFTKLLPGTKRLGMGFQMPTPLGADPNTNRYLLQRIWLSAFPQGRGVAIFAPFRMWQHWRPGFVGFDAFHSSLMRRGAGVATAGAQTLLPSPDPRPHSRQMFPEITNFAQSILLTNHRPATAANAKLPATLVTGSKGNFLWKNAVCVFGANAQPLLLPPRPVPPGVADNSSVTSVTRLFSYVEDGQSERLVRRAIRLQYAQGTNSAAAALLKDTKEALRISVWPGAASAVPRGGDFDIPLDSGTVRLIIGDMSSSGGYDIAPNSKHQLTITDFTKRGKKDNKPHQKTVVVTANANGEIILQLHGSSLRVDLSPVAK